jgi:hypothetical protein
MRHAARQLRSWLIFDVGQYMQITTEAFPLFDFVTGWAIFLSFLTVIFCVATLRSHIDEAKIREEESISAFFRSPIPPEHILTPVGKRRVKIAKIGIGVFVVSAAAIVVRTQILAS